MIARLSVLLPYHFTVPDNTSFRIHRGSLGDYQFEFRPPARSDIPLPEDSPEVIKVDGKLAFLADVLVIDFRKPGFDRRTDGPNDPPYELMRDVVNWLLNRLRYVIGASDIRPIDFPNASWRLEYLTDQATELRAEKGLLTGRGTSAASFSWMTLTPEVWDSVFGLPGDFETPPWEALLLDARGALPEIGQSIVLAATALEVFIAAILDGLASNGKVSSSLWHWINGRGDFLKEPSVEEQFDVLLLELLGTSLKSNQRLWQLFIEQKQARNKFVHGGVPIVGRTPVTPARAAEFVQGTREIVDFIKERLPDDLKWPKPQHKVEVSVQKIIRKGSQKPPLEKPKEQHE